MANHKSALKRHRQSLNHRLRNSHYRTTVKTVMAKALTAVESGSKEAESMLKLAISTVDKVRGKGIIPKNRAGRYVSRLSKALDGVKK